MEASPSTSADIAYPSSQSPTLPPFLPERGLFHAVEPLGIDGCLRSRKAPDAVASQHSLLEAPMGRGILLWLIGVPIPLIILILLFWR